MQRVIVDCTTVRDAQGRTYPPVALSRDLTSQEQTAYDNQQITAANERTAAEAAATQRVNDMEAVRLAGAREPAFTSVHRLLGGTG